KSADGRPGLARARDIRKAFDQGQRKNDQQDQAENNKAIPGAVQGTAELFGAYQAATDGEDNQSEKDQKNKCVQKRGEHPIVTQAGERCVERAKDQIEQAELDDNKAPERKEVSNARNGIAQHAALSQDRQKELSDAIPYPIGAVFRASLSQ